MKILSTAILLTLGLVSTNVFSATFEGNIWTNGFIPYEIDSSLTGKPLRSFERAVRYYDLNTSIRFHEVQPGESFNTVVKVQLSPRAATSNWSNATIGMPCNGCSAPTISLDDSADRWLAIHEMFHTLGFNHEQQRADRDEYITINQNSFDNETKGNFSRVNSSRTIGPFDFDSISMYRYNQIALATTVPSELFDIMAKRAPYKREFRLNLVDSTPNNILDNPTLNVETGTLKANNADVDYEWNSALWDFKYTGNSDIFLIRNKKTNEYLIDNNGSTSTARHSAVSGNQNQWHLKTYDKYFILQNASSNKYLRKSSTGNIYSTSISSWASKWLVQAVSTSSATGGLTPADKLALHQVYGYEFRIQLSDNTSNTSDNPSLHVQDSYSGNNIDVTAAESGWHSAMWSLERVGRFFRIKNKWTGEYLHTENNVIERDHPGTTNNNGADIADWWSAQWDLEIEGKGFRIKNRWTGMYLFSQNAHLSLTDFPIGGDSTWSFTPVE